MILMKKPYRDDVRLAIKLTHALMEAPMAIINEIYFDAKNGLSTDLDEISKAVESPDDFVYFKLRFPKEMVEDLALAWKNSPKGFNQHILSILDSLLESPLDRKKV